MYDNPRRNRLVALIAVVLVVIVGTWKFVSYRHTFQNVTISYSTSDVTSLGIYKSETYPYDTTPHTVGKSVQNLQSGKTYSLKKGSYLLAPTGPKIDTSKIAVNIGATAVRKTLDIPYSYTYLQAQLASQEPGIIATLNASNPLIPQLYVINPGTLYQHGEWYGTTLSYKGPDTLSRDTLRAVLHYMNGSWVVATNPPEISLSSKDYPNIPLSVLSAVNAIDLGLPQIVSQ